MKTLHRVNHAEVYGIARSLDIDREIDQVLGHGALLLICEDDLGTILETRCSRLGLTKVLFMSTIFMQRCIYKNNYATSFLVDFLTKPEIDR
jgi:hypothetical protein